MDRQKAKEAWIAAGKEYPILIESLEYDLIHSPNSALNTEFQAGMREERYSIYRRMTETKTNG